MITDDDFARLGDLPIGDLVAALLQEWPRMSAGELREAWIHLHPDDEDPPAKAAFKRLRDQASSRGVAPAEPEAGAETIDQARLLREVAHSIEIHDVKGAIQWLDLLKRAAGLASPTDAGEDWSRLSEPEAAALAALTRKLYGEDLTADDRWWTVAIAAVPAQAVAEHPAHLPLPSGGRPAKVGP